MPPIDPNELLKAFKPLLTVVGGIKSEEEVPRLSGLMDKYSKKLVSRCTYCNILNATDDQLLEVFLEQKGWAIMNLWLKEAITNGNNAFLQELMILFERCPMTVERLRLNDTPKLIKSLIKSEDTALAERAKRIKQKWRKVLEVDKPPQTTAAATDPEAELKKKRKKDKTDGSINEISDQVAKRPKIKKLPPKSPATTDNNNLQTKDTCSKDKTDTVEQNPEAVKRSTVKIRLGKNRGAPLAEDSKQPKQDRIIVKISTGNDQKTSKIITSAPPQPVKPKPALKESLGFLEDIVGTSGPTVRKKRKIDASKPKTGVGKADGASKDEKKNDESNASGQSQISPETNDDDSNAVSEESCNESLSKCNINASDDNGNGGGGNDESISEKSAKDAADAPEEPMEVDESNVAAAVVSDAPDPDDLPIIASETSNLKSILCTRKDPNRTKRSIRWQTEDNLREIFMFELDETERVNVNKIAFGELRNIELRKERDLMNMSKEREKSFMPWRFIPLELPPDHLVVIRGCESKEKMIREKENAVMSFQLPNGPNAECPGEPDFFQPGLISPALVRPPTIPLEDDSGGGAVHDFSAAPAPMSRPVVTVPPVEAYSRPPAPSYAHPHPQFHSHHPMPLHPHHRPAFQMPAHAHPHPGPHAQHMGPYAHPHRAPMTPYTRPTHQQQAPSSHPIAGPPPHHQHMPVHYPRPGPPVLRPGPPPPQQIPSHQPPPSSINSSASSQGSRYAPRNQIPCKFYGRGAGCKNPTSCPYMHGPASGGSNPT